MTTTRRSLLQLVRFHCAGIFWSCLISLWMLWLIIRKGRKAVFARTERPHRPAVMNDEALGSHKTIKLSEVNLHYVEAGDRNKPLMLFLHGFPECWFTWRFQIREFKDRFRVVAIDMRGYGESDKPRNVVDYHLNKLSGDIKELIPALGYDKCVLVAHDWGGIVASDFTTRYPDLVEKLILFNTAHPMAFEGFLQKSWKQYLMSWYVFVFCMPYLPEILIQNLDLAVFDGYAKKQEGARKAPCDRDEVEAYKYTMARPGCLTSGLNYYRAFGRYKLPNYNGQARIRVPTVLIWGVKDVALSRELAEENLQYIPDLKIHWVENAGHAVMQEEPDAVNQYLTEFLA